MQTQKKRFIFNISPSRVAGAITYLDNKKGIPVIEYITEKKIDLSGDFTLNEFRTETLKAIDGVCTDFIEQGKLVNGGNYFVDSADVFLMSPWVEYDNYNLQDEAVVPFLVDDTYLEKFFKQKNNYQDKTILHSDITSVKANGYNVDLMDLKKQEIKKLNISIFESFVLNFDRHFIDGAIKNHFSLIKINFNSFLPVLLNQIQQLYNTKDDFVFIDISSEITEFGVFIDGEVKNIMTIPFGINKVLNKIVREKLVDNLYQARSFLNMYFEKQLEEKESSIIENIIKEEVDKIRGEVNRVMKYGDDMRLPVNSFIVSSVWETNKLIRESKIFENLFFIDRNVIENFVDFESAGKWDNFLALETEFSYRFR